MSSQIPPHINFSPKWLKSVQLAWANSGSSSTNGSEKPPLDQYIMTQFIYSNLSSSYSSLMKPLPSVTVKNNSSFTIDGIHIFQIVDGIPVDESINQLLNEKNSSSVLDISTRIRKNRISSIGQHSVYKLFLSDGNPDNGIFVGIIHKGVKTLLPTCSYGAKILVKSPKVQNQTLLFDADSFLYLGGGIITETDLIKKTDLNKNKPNRQTVTSSINKHSNNVVLRQTSPNPSDPFLPTESSQSSTKVPLSTPHLKSNHLKPFHNPSVSSITSKNISKRPIMLPPAKKVEKTIFPPFQETKCEFIHSILNSNIPVKNNSLFKILGSIVKIESLNASSITVVIEDGSGRVIAHGLSDFIDTIFDHNLSDQAAALERISTTLWEFDIVFRDGQFFIHKHSKPNI